MTLSSSKNIDTGTVGESDALSAALLDWYDANRRRLPWREDPTPYHVWVSEIMLQQTRVEAVLGYYERFMERLPDVAALAGAEEDLCLKLWEGLGYYSRVRNLHKAAQVIMTEYGGEMPRTREELRKLPGIGDYTSAAIASIAYGESVPAVDGNFLRVFARMTRYEKNIKEEAAKKAADLYFSQRISRERPGDYNQAVMDLGAGVCIPHGEPLCLVCPWQQACQAHQEMAGSEGLLPVMPEKKVKPVTRLTVFVIRVVPAEAPAEAKNGQTSTPDAFLSGNAEKIETKSGPEQPQVRRESWPEQQVLIRQRPGKGLLAGLYEFPNTEGWLNRKEALAFLETLGITGTQVQNMKKLPPAKHVFTHRIWQMHGYEVLIKGPVVSPRLILTDLHGLAKTYTIPSAFSAYEAQLFEDAGGTGPTASF